MSLHRLVKHVAKHLRDGRNVDGCLVRTVRDAEATADIHELELDAELLLELHNRVEENRDGLTPVLLVEHAGACHHVDAEARGASLLRLAVGLDDLERSHAELSIRSAQHVRLGLRVGASKALHIFSIVNLRSLIPFYHKANNFTGLRRKHMSSGQRPRISTRLSTSDTSAFPKQLSEIL